MEQIINCTLTDCKYNTERICRKEVIEIDINVLDKPRCYSYEVKDEDE